MMFEDIWSWIGIAVAVGGAVVLIPHTLVAIRPTHRGLIERFGKYNRFAEPGMNIILPFVEHCVMVNITEQMVEAAPQEIITEDKLNAKVDAQIYFRVKPDEVDVKASQYSVNNYSYQIVNLARTTLRNIIGTLSLNEANSDRGKINNMLMTTLETETKNWGIEVVRAELKEIDPPSDVQDTMNKVVKAENEKRAAVDFATARETQADGERRASIKAAEGKKQAAILEAEGAANATIKVAEAEAQKIQLVNDALNEHFKDQAVTFKQLETAASALKDNVKYVIGAEKDLSLVVSEAAGITPLKR